MKSLPIDPHLPELVSALRRQNALVLKAPPGAGKTTRVPPALLEAGLAGDGVILVLEPRRLAARAAAGRMAAERGKVLGDEVGYRIRFETCASENTRILVVTEGILTRRLQKDPFLDGVNLVILDEFHERSIHTDLALAFLKDLMGEARPDLKVVVMSATLAPDPVSAYLGGCEVMEIPVTHHPVETVWLDRRDERALSRRVAMGIDRALSLDPEGGDILTFLPGMAEIRRTEEAIRARSAEQGIAVVPLHGDLPGEAQDRAIRPWDQRKIILTTNIAETSLTIEGVSVVVDSGYAKVMRHDPRYGLDRLELERISKASAEQRAGRAGRTGPGLALRLWTRGEHASLAAADVPEIRRVDLASVLLEVLAWGSRDVECFPWFEPPPLAAVERAFFLLERLGALSPDRRSLTRMGKAILELPMHPRLARILIEAEGCGFTSEAACMAAILSERDLLLRARYAHRAHRTGPPFTGPSDLLYRLDLLEKSKKARFRVQDLKRLDIDPAAARAVHRASEQYRVIMRHSRNSPVDRKGPGTAESGAAREDALLRILSIGFPDRVAKRKQKGSDAFIMVGGRGVVPAEESVVRREDLILCLSVEGGRKGIHARSLVRIASKVEVEWLEDDFPDRFRSETFLAFDGKQEKVVGGERLFFDDLLLEDRPSASMDPEAAAEVLVRAAAGNLEAALTIEPRTTAFLDRVRCLREWMPEIGLPDLDHGDLEVHLPEICRGKTSFSETRKVSILPFFKKRLDGSQLALLEKHAPEGIRIPSGKRVSLVYEPGRPPVLSARIQELFGLVKTPTVASGRVRILVDLLGPNMRTVQRTEDLENFWKHTYARVRKDLRGRYPKHDWPEDPLLAKPPRGGPRRKR